MTMETVFSQAAEKVAGGRVIRGLSADALRKLASPEERTTKYGSASYITRVRSRSAKFTEIAFRPDAGHPELMEKVVRHLAGRELLSIDRIMCMHDGYRTRIRLFVTKEHARLAYMWGRQLFEPPDAAGEKGAGGAKADFTIVGVPDWPERRIIVDPVSYTTFILGSDYCGEVKKAGLRMMMHAHKAKRGGLGLHAGSKVLRVRDAASGKIVEKGMLLFGLSATGKTTLTCHHHWLDAGAGEEVRIRQDDVVLLNRDGSAAGTEDNFYIKTDGLEPDSQPLLYKGAISPNAILENVKVDGDGNVDFFDNSITSNGRGVVMRSELDYTDGSIDVGRVDMIVFITRRKTIVPPIARLTPEQAAAFFMLGESVESSAGDPAQAGNAIRVVGTNPFIIGPPEEEGNRFYEILKANPKAECYLLDTGRFGAHPGSDEGVKITVYDSARLLADAARGAIKWKKDPDWGYEVAAEVGDVDMKHFDPRAFYGNDEYGRLTEELRRERREWLGRFPGLDRRIADSI